ncbi:MAG: S1 RNA-binding domain-containing protein [Oscillospiraceae bacterium]
MQHEIGAIVEGKVTGITKFGAFIDLPSGETGMVHISEISNEYINNVSDVLKENDTVKVKILSISDNGKISLSIKKALPKPAFKSNRDNNRNFEKPNRQPFSRGTAQTWQPPQEKKPASFDDMLSKFLQSSDEKMSDLKQKERPTRRSGGGKKSKNYYDD